MKLTPAYIAAQVLTCAFDYDGTFTTCTITTKHGTKHVGTSGCLDPANYNRESGEQIAHKNALDQLWALEGYFFSKLGLSQAKGVVDERLGVAVDVRDRGEKWYQPHVAVTVHMQPEPVVNVIHSWDTAFTKSPEFSREVIEVALKGKGFRSMADGGYVGGKKDGAE